MYRRQNRYLSSCVMYLSCAAMESISQEVHVDDFSARDFMNVL
jgi:hypothetical protein